MGGNGGLEFGVREALICAREALDLTLTDVAARVGLSVEELEGFERGEAEPTVSTFARLAIGLEFTPSGLLHAAERGDAFPTLSLTSREDNPRDFDELIGVIVSLLTAGPTQSALEPENRVKLLAELVSIALEEAGDNEFDHFRQDGWGSPPWYQLLAETAVTPAMDRGRRLLRVLWELYYEYIDRRLYPPDQPESLDERIRAIAECTADWLPWKADELIVWIGLLPRSDALDRDQIRALLPAVRAALTSPDQS